MKKLILSLCRHIVHLFYPFILEERKKEELISLSKLKSSGESIFLGDGCVFIGSEYISIGSYCGFGRGCRIEAIGKYNKYNFSPEIVFGKNVTLEDWCHIGCIDKVEIGDGTMIASRVFITDHFHGNITFEDFKYERPSLRPLSSKPVKIGRNVWIGEGVSIMPGVELGDNVIVGANTVVTHSFKSNTVIAGCPARVIKEF